MFFPKECPKRRRINRHQILTWSFEYSIYFISAIVYAAGLNNDLGDDYGYYFVGSRSIDEDYPLYEAWFDNKGPLFFLFTKVLTSMLPYTLFGAKVFLAILFLLWCLACSYCAKQFGLSGQNRIVLALITISSLIGMSSNSVVGIFLAALLVVFFVNFYSLLVSDTKKLCGLVPLHWHLQI